MKKAKILLTALTVVAVVGGALAFKAQKTAQGGFYCTTGSFCDDTLPAYITGSGSPLNCIEKDEAPANCTFATLAQENQ